MPAITLPRGMKDIDQKEMAIRLWINEKIKTMLKLYGFQLVEPTALEHLETLQTQAGEDVKNEIYWFKDKGGRDLGLRFDLTVGLTRMAASNATSPEPIKIACVSNMWRYDEPQFGRMRNFYQWDVEIFGSKEAEADAEIICLGIDILEALGLKEYEVRIGNRKLTEGFLESSGVMEPVQKESVMRVIDKKRKLSEDDLRREFRKYRVDDRQMERIMNFIARVGKPGAVIKELKEMGLNSDRAREGLDELMKLVYILQVRDKVRHCVLDMSIVRGIGYYTGNVFECYDRGNENVGAIWGGGRFDSLCRAYGKDRPAVGVAGGMERLMISLEKNGLVPAGLAQTPMVFVASVNDEVRDRVLEIADALRGEGIAADFDLRGRKLGKQLEYADATGIPYVLVVGPEELKRSKFKLKDMSRKAEKAMTLGEIVGALKH